MATTIFDALQNADYNLQHNISIGVEIGKNQLHNAVVLLDKGYGLNEAIDDLIEKYENIEDAPEKTGITP